MARCQSSCCILFRTYARKECQTYHEHEYTHIEYTHIQSVDPRRYARGNAHIARSASLVRCYVQECLSRSGAASDADRWIRRWWHGVCSALLRGGSLRTTPSRLHESDQRAMRGLWACYGLLFVVCHLLLLSREGLLSSPFLPKSDNSDLSASPANWSVTNRKSTRLNSSHSQISYAVFCL